MNPILRGMICNEASLTDDSADPRLRPITLPLDLAAAIDFAERRIDATPRWRVESIDRSAPIATLHATRRTRVWRFVDDVRLTFEPDPRSRGTRVKATSRSRVGKGDLGQNPRNLRELVAALRLET